MTPSTPESAAGAPASGHTQTLLRRPAASPSPATAPPQVDAEADGDLAAGHHAPPATALGRWATFLYGTLCYAMFLGVFLYAIGFVVGVGVPVTLDSLPGKALWPALAINLGLLAVFAVQHSGMARRGFKSWLTRSVHPMAERATYVLASNLAMIALFAFWQPLGGVVWSVESSALHWLLLGIGLSGWGLVLLSTFLINHFDLFGLRQAWLALRGKAYTPVRFREPMMYRVVRHPLYLGWVLAFWGAPTMTVAHLVFSVMCTAYILIAIQLEERDLVREHGAAYEAYRRRVPMLIPSVRLLNGRAMRAAGTAAFLFFLVKGLAWIGVGVGIAML